MFNRNLHGRLLSSMILQKVENCINNEKQINETCGLVKVAESNKKLENNMELADAMGRNIVTSERRVNIITSQ